MLRENRKEILKKLQDQVNYNTDGNLLIMRLFLKRSMSLACDQITEHWRTIVVEPLYLISEMNKESLESMLIGLLFQKHSFNRFSFLIVLKTVIPFKSKSENCK